MKRKTWIALAGSGVLAVGLLVWAFAPRPVEVEAVLLHLQVFLLVVRVQILFVLVQHIHLQILLVLEILEL